MPKITDIKAYEILDSRATPTVKAHVFLDNGSYCEASVPSGASKGIHEARELRDFDLTRYLGNGVLKAIDTIQNTIAPKLKGMDPVNQKEIDDCMIEMDGSSDKSRLGANSILAVSLAVARAGAQYGKKIPLYEYLAQLSGQSSNWVWPVPMLNVINGGMHGGNNLSIQEFLIMPSDIKSMPEKIRMGAEIYQSLKKLIKENEMSVAVGDEGGFSPSFESDAKALELLESAISVSGYSYITDVTIGLDMAASTYFTDGVYRLNGIDHPMMADEYSRFVEKLKKDFHIQSLEDAFAEDEWDAWTNVTKNIGNETMIVGDDLLVTNRERLQTAIEKKACNAILVKVNQIGTLSETLDVIRMAKKAQFKVVISHRSGETTDDFIADLAIGVHADFVKFGAPARGERVAKYNRLLSIYETCRTHNS